MKNKRNDDISTPTMIASILITAIVLWVTMNPGSIEWLLG